MSWNTPIHGQQYGHSLFQLCPVRYLLSPGWLPTPQLKLMPVPVPKLHISGGLTVGDWRCSNVTEMRGYFLYGFAPPAKIIQRP